jgi:hypothetical protein
VHHCMAVLDYPEWDVAALLDSEDKDRVRIYTIKRDPQLEADLIERLRAFWEDHILKRVPPEAVSAADATSYIHRLFQLNNGCLRALPPDSPLLGFVEDLQRRHYELRQLTAYIEGVKNQIKEIIADADGITFTLNAHNGGKTEKITWKKCKDGLSTDWRAVAIAAGASPELIQKHTKTVPGVRRFLCPKSWNAGGKDGEHQD